MGNNAAQCVQLPGTSVPDPGMLTTTVFLSTFYNVSAIPKASELEEGRAPGNSLAAVLS